MKKTLLLILFTLFTILPAKASLFEVLVLPVDILSSCDNYYCFPEPSNIIANDVIYRLSAMNDIGSINIDDVRRKINASQTLKIQVATAVTKYKIDNTVDFSTLQNIANQFGVKSILLISSYVTNDKSSLHRNLWEMLELCNTFKISYPFNLETSVVLTDSVNSVIMWSSKYNKKITDSNDNFNAKTLTQAISQLEKIKYYSKFNISNNISQNIKLRFFPKEVRTIDIETSNDNMPQFTPNALEKLVKPKILEELNNQNNYDNINDFIFQF